MPSISARFEDKVSAQAWLYDGESANRYPVRVSRDGGGLQLLFANGLVQRVPADRLTHVETRDGAEVYGRNDAPGWRLGMEGAAPELAELLPARQQYGRWIDRVGIVPAVLAAALLSVLVLFAGGKAPEWLAPAVPPQWEERFGDTLVGDFGGKFCNAPAGQAALRKLARRLSPETGELNIRVVDIDLVNAAALPGGNIVIFEELLTRAEGAEEVAGVLAHEIAHIEERHVTEGMIRSLGLGLIVSAFGGSTGANIEGLLAAGYSREAEREADAAAIAALRRANVSPLGTAAFFARLGKGEEGLGRVAEGLSYLSTHPMSAERQRAFRDSAIPGKAYAPALSPQEWKALTAICKPVV